MSDLYLGLGQSNFLRTFNDPDAQFAFENLTGGTVINAAVGGTPFSAVKPRNWSDFSEGSPYDLMLDAVGDQEIDAILISGGEGDANCGASTFSVLMALLRLEHHLDRDVGDAPIIIIPVMADIPGAAAVNRGLRLYALISDDAQLIRPDGVSFEDGLHFDDASRVTVAQAFAHAVIDL